MTILALGINHKTASVSLREKVAFVESKRQLAFEQISQQNLAESAVILSTCNRTELYFHQADIPPQEDHPENIAWRERCFQWFAEIHQLDHNELRQCIYFKQNMDTARHLMEVACGLDSLILGEPQILGQVKQAYQDSEYFYHQQGKSISTNLSRLFQKTFSTAKRVRSETEIGASAVSVAYAACGLARQIFDDFAKLRFLLVGAGETIELVARYLIQHGAQNLMVANRTHIRAEMLAEKLETPMQILSLSALQVGLNQADVVISSTGSPDLLISKEMVETAQKQRRFDPMLLIDIAVPRDIDEKAGELDSVYAYSVDDLQHIIQQNLAQRQQAAEQAKEIVEQECKDFFAWLKQQQSSQLIKHYRQNAEEIRLDLLEKARNALEQGQDSEKILQELSYKLMNQLLHAPTSALQNLAKDGNVKGLQRFSQALKLDDIN
ncbi:Glutamyl-tRNA reductase [Bibersteinia trehalosi USDA-ARS-USMARC-188]|uniref:Glutamyl-tRNA reductase n=3 Tax=Bibersteinia trehalosi TaxID=47735 RepID=W0R7A6_BIBTR|nr:glutamyl-tRNA reductase [Bibersteinia trehalosi]AGH38682.1 Glutamyl-tRNA reductase [Bibersteinia trehalosi USDA-ARS-USMARC-192]AHG81517.1 Glutamyl-tRNA reductase [Bibersteinia trehalosi USDA-ARS-USMARC-188]AHG83788.1 Glutamyl-tRNA reductase [Bibersteinia trehalosi USDA-ARS-USMARC-189]AHG86666.1 Glutamyl-tRNA reductase [Bibersteinia trehalosi USDA-ARS-USMARC-190]TCT17817.1 glutamyl-tRNA reductase [Bibersteinia trehalosi]